MAITAPASACLLTQLPKANAKRLSALLSIFNGDVSAAATFTTSQLVDAGFAVGEASAASSYRDDFDFSLYQRIIDEKGITVLTAGAQEYPEVFSSCQPAAPIVFVRGNPAALKSMRPVAIVGTRVPSVYGKKVTADISAGLTHMGATIVSGLASGVDSAAHTACLDAGGTTVAVLGCGIDSVYPTKNKSLLERILAEGGAVISEYAPGVLPMPFHFPARNRLVAALSKAVLVVEGTIKSGSLITADLALDSGIDVCAVPGSIFSPLSAGPHALIRQGALVATSAQDIADALNWNAKAAPNVSFFGSEDENAIYEVLAGQPQSTEHIIQSTRLAASTVAATLSMLQIKKVITEIEPGVWTRSSLAVGTKGS